MSLRGWWLRTGCPGNTPEGEGISKQELDEVSMEILTDQKGAIEFIRNTGDSFPAWGLTITMDILNCAFLKENICFIKEENGTPGMS